MRLQAAVRDHRDAIAAFDYGIGFLERLIGIAGDLLARGFGAIARFDQILFAHQVRQ